MLTEIRIFEYCRHCSEGLLCNRGEPCAPRTSEGDFNERDVPELYLYVVFLMNYSV